MSTSQILVEHSVIAHDGIGDDEGIVGEEVPPRPHHELQLAFVGKVARVEAVEEESVAGPAVQDGLAVVLETVGIEIPEAVRLGERSCIARTLLKLMTQDYSPGTKAFKRSVRQASS